MKWILFYLSIILAPMVVCGSNVDSKVGSPAPNLKHWRLNSPRNLSNGEKVKKGIKGATKEKAEKAKSDKGTKGKKTKNKEDKGVVYNESTPPPSPPPPTEPPTLSPSMRVEVEAAAQFPVIYSVVQASPFVNTSLPSDSLAYYSANRIHDVSQPPAVRALSWVLNEDPRDPAPNNPFLVLRFALVTMFYANQGETWTNLENWLSAEHACEWHGVNCDRFKVIIEEIDLDDNNMKGTIPLELSLLTDLRSLVLSKNELTGTIPAEMLGSLSNLSILLLNDNKLSGDLEAIEPVKNNGVLSTLHIQQNNITGRWPRNFCPRTGEPDIFGNFAIDCYSDTRCLCCDGNNCF